MTFSYQKKKNHITSLKVRWHLLGWSLFIGYELGYVLWLGIPTEPLIDYLVFYTINIGYFYAFLFFLRQATHIRPQGFQRSLIGLVLVFWGCLFLRILVDHLLILEIDFRVELRRYLPQDFFRNLYFSMLATFYWAASSFQRARAERAEAEQHRLISENQFAAARNAYLRQQLSPHLLFNSLNLVYSQVFRVSEEAGNCVMQLSDIMRYSLDEGDPDGKVLLASELEQIHHLVAINRTRFDDEVFFSLSVTGETADLRIIPLILFTLTENIFKHGELQCPDSPASVAITIDGSDCVLFKSVNLSKSAMNARNRLGTGLANLRTRLDYAYPGAYDLTVNEDRNEFKVSLSIRL